MDLPRWHDATAAAGILLVAEAWETDRELVARRPGEIGADVVGPPAARCVDRCPGPGLGPARCKRSGRRASTRSSDASTSSPRPRLTVFPPALDGGEELLMARCTLPVNLAGVPALALPVPIVGALPASLQLIGPPHGEEMLLAAGLVLEAALSTL